MRTSIIATIATIATIAATLILAGCETLEKGRDIAGAGAGKAIVGECGISPAQRGKNLASINKWLADNGHKHRGTPLDCNGDGKPDDLPS